MEITAIHNLLLPAGFIPYRWRSLDRRVLWDWSHGNCRTKWQSL